ncbi:MAG: ATP-binding protein [Azonexus sp.]|nr:ATP-binding protein [Azonexus sp.]MDZ4316677.1 ATP-binding protein [Azonexus sp.]
MKVSFSIFNWRSLRTRITVGMLIVCLSVLWVTVLALSHSLRQDMEATISAQQFSTISLIASDIDRAVRERQHILQSIASKLSSKIKPADSSNAAQDYLEWRDVPDSFFNWGVMVIDLKGMAIASTPESLQRRGVDFSKYLGVDKVLASGQPFVADPIFSEHSQQPVLAMLAPILGPNGKVLGAVIGVTNLHKTNFFDAINAAKYGLTGDFVITAPATRAYVASSDPRRIMKNGPPVGVNAVYDRYIDGYEGSGVARSSRGVVELSSSKRIAATGWLMQSILPADEAFASIRRMQQHLLIISLCLTLLATAATWWWLRRQLQPLAEASELLDAMRDGKIDRQALPVRKMDEIGQLTAAFNGLQEAMLAEEAKAAEHTANQRLRRIVSYIPGVVFQYRRYPDGSGNFPFISDGVGEMYGVTPDEMAQSSASIRKMVHPDDLEKFFRALDESAKNLTPWRIEYRINHPDGQLKWLLVNAIPEQGVDNDIIWYGFIADITETRAMEIELRLAIAEHTRKDAEIVRYRDHLEQLVSERTAALEIARADAERLAKTKSEFLANMSHEIRTPLNGVLGMAYIGLRATTDGSKAHEAFSKINNSGKLLLGLINDILDFSKMEAGMLKLESTSVDLRLILNESLELMHERATAKGLDLQLKPAPDMPKFCLSDPLRLRQILLNLLSNAIKFTDTGSVTLEAGLTENQLLIRVSDSGIGMTEAQISKIFAPFEQGDNSTTRKFGGTGLGLSITERIVRLMGGRIEVSSQPGVGSIFAIRLPYLPHLPLIQPVSIAPPLSRRQPLAGLKILVVEDNEINQEIMQENLSEDGARVTVVDDGQQAVDCIRQSTPGSFDIVLMDIQMPVMNGHDAARAILRIAPDLPIIGQTAHALSQDRDACLAAGMVDHIAKPIDPEKLIAMILKHTVSKLETSCS